MTEQRPPSTKNHYSEHSMRPADVLYYDREIARRQRILKPPVGGNPYGQEMLVGGVDGTQIDVAREAALLPQPDENIICTMYDAQSPYALTVSMRHNRALLYLCDESDSGPIPRKAEGYALKMSLVDMSHLADMRFITLGEPVVSLPDPRNHRAALTITPDAIGVFGVGTAVDDGSNENQPAQGNASPYSMNVMKYFTHSLCSTKRLSGIIAALKSGVMILLDLVLLARLAVWRMDGVVGSKNKKAEE